jgi:hypothetical protein
VPEDPPTRIESVIYQLEDAGDPLMRLRQTVRMVDGEGATRYLYRIEAFSRLSGKLLGGADLLAELGSEEEFAASAREFQTAPFRAVMSRLSQELRDRYGEIEAATEIRV